MILSIDTETYGICKKDARGQTLPPQTLFHPARMRETDGVSLGSIIQTASLTIVDGDPLKPWEWQPAETRVFRFSLSNHRRWYAQWLRRATTLVGQNINYDLLCLSALPQFSFLKQRTHHLTDLSVINYLHSETRPERSLKNLGPLLGLFSYSEKEASREKAYEDANDPQLLRYNGADTHNTVLAVQALASLIRRDFPSSAKLSEWCLRHYSDVLWVCFAMGLRGVPMDRSRLQSLLDEQQRLVDDAVAKAAAHDLILEGKGASTIGEPTSRYGFMDRLIAAVDKENPNAPTLRADRRIRITPARHAVSYCDENRNLIAGLLPEGHSLVPPLLAFAQHSKAQKLISSYLYPLLHHARANPNKRDGIILSDGRAYPTWYPVPSPVKDSSGDSGGTEQGRITAKGPAIQTFPPPVKACILPEPSYSLLWCDLSQIELRVAALLSGEPALLAAFNEGRDIHSERAIAIFGHSFLLDHCGTPLDKSNPRFHPYRQVGKMINFADLFLAQASTMKASIMRELGLDLKIGLFKKIEEDRPKVRPVLYAWQQSLIADAKKNRRLELPFTGQSRWFQGGDATIDETYINTIVNFPIQTTAGNVMLRLQHLLSRRLPPLTDPKPWAEQIANIYDAVGVHCLTTRLPDLKASLVATKEELTTTDYWAMLEAHTQRRVPFEYEIDVVESL